MYIKSINFNLKQTPYDPPSGVGLAERIPFVPVYTTFEINDKYQPELGKKEMMLEMKIFN